MIVIWTCDFPAGETVTVSGSIGQPTANYAVPGIGRRTVWEVDATITTQGPAPSTDVMQDLFSPDLRIPVQTSDHLNGSFGAFRFSADVQAQLTSGPA